MSMIGNYRRVTSSELSTLLENPDSISDFLYSETDEIPTNRQLDIDKTWHAIHFLLNDDPWEGNYPLVCVVMGGESIGTQDVGYGPARYLTPDVVKEASSALDEIPVQKLFEKYNHVDLNDNDIYPQGWTEHEEHRDYIGQYYEQLVVFFREAALTGDNILVYLN